MLMVNIGVFFVVLVALFGVYLWLVNQEKVLVGQQASIPVVQKQAIEEANKANGLSQLVLSVAKTDFFPVEVLNGIAGLNKDSITVAGLSISLSEKSGDFSGVAKDRVAMLAFKQALEDMEEVGVVYLPISSFTEDKDIPFQVKFTLTDKVLLKE
jgi:hypothetical protein